MPQRPLVLLPHNFSESIYYGTYSSPYGEVLLLTIAQGVCGLHFLEKPLDEYLQLAENTFGKRPVRVTEQTDAWWAVIEQGYEALQLFVQGTPFQLKVWEALCGVPEGVTQSYQQVAHQLGLTRSARAVGNAVAQNSIAWLIPCHRVVRQDGRLGNYRWGIARKKALLAAEGAGQWPC